VYACAPARRGAPWRNASRLAFAARNSNRADASGSAPDRHAQPVRINHLGLGRENPHLAA
jgi:hypothetical protein